MKTTEYYTRNEWRRCENYTRNEWRRCENYTRNECIFFRTRRRDLKPHSYYPIQAHVAIPHVEIKEDGTGTLINKRARFEFEEPQNGGSSTLETSGEDLKSTLETSGRCENYTRNEWRRYILVGCEYFHVTIGVIVTDLPGEDCGTLKTTLETSEELTNYTRNEWGTHKLHSKRVGNPQSILETSRDLTIHTRNEWKTHHPLPSSVCLVSPRSVAWP